MRTLIIYVTRLLLGTASTLAFLIAVPILVFAFLLALPGPLTDPIGALLWGVDNDLKFSLIRSIFSPLLMIAITFFFWKMEKFSMRQDATKRRYYRRFSLIYLLVLFYVLGILIINISSPFYGKCDVYTNKLNGGLHAFGERNYRIELCGSGPDETGANDHMRLRIFDDNDALRATRYFRLDWDVNEQRELEYLEREIIYFDHGDQNGHTKKMTIPPTLLDWLISHIPLLA